MTDTVRGLAAKGNNRPAPGDQTMRTPPDRYLLGDRRWLQKAKKEGDKVRENRHERLDVGGVPVWSRNGAASHEGCEVNGRMTNASNK